MKISSMDAFLLGCFIINSVYHYFLVFFYKKNHGALFFAFISTGAATLTIMRNVNWDMKHLISLLVFILVPIFFVEFTLTIFPEEFNNKNSKFSLRVFRGYGLLYSISMCILHVIKGSEFIENTSSLQKPIMIAMFTIFVFILVEVILAVIHKYQNAIFLFVGYILLFATTSVICLISDNALEKGNPVGVIGMLMLYSVVLAKKL